jgi:hypothetical protein
VVTAERMVVDVTVRKVAVTRVHTGDRVGDDVQRLAQRAATSANQMPFSTGVWKRGVTLSTTPTSVAHGLGRVPTGFFATVAKATSYDDALAPKLWTSRLMNGASLASLSNTAGNFTTGNRFTALTTRECIGIRFPGYCAGASKTFRLSLWDDATATLLASVDVVLATNTFRWCVGVFPAPVLLKAGRDYTVSCWHTAAGFYIKTPTDGMNGFLPITWGADLTLKAMNLWVAASGRPTSTSATESYWVEPALADRRAVQVERSSLTPADPMNQLSLVAAESATVDLWIY